MMSGKIKFSRVQFLCNKLFIAGTLFFSFACSSENSGESLQLRGAQTEGDRGEATASDAKSVSSQSQVGATSKVWVIDKSDSEPVNIELDQSEDLAYVDLSKHKNERDSIIEDLTIDPIDHSYEVDVYDPHVDDTQPADQLKASVDFDHESELSFDPIQDVGSGFFEDQSKDHYVDDVIDQQGSQDNIENELGANIPEVAESLPQAVPDELPSSIDTDLEHQNNISSLSDNKVTALPGSPSKSELQGNDNNLEFEVLTGVPVIPGDSEDDSDSSRTGGRTGYIGVASTRKLPEDTSWLEEIKKLDLGQYKRFVSSGNGVRMIVNIHNDVRFRAIYNGGEGTIRGRYNSKTREVNGVWCEDHKGKKIGGPIVLKFNFKMNRIRSSVSFNEVGGDRLGRFLYRDFDAKIRRTKLKPFLDTDKNFCIPDRLK